MTCREPVVDRHACNREAQELTSSASMAASAAARVLAGCASGRLRRRAASTSRRCFWNMAGSGDGASRAHPAISCQLMSAPRPTTAARAAALGSAARLAASASQAARNGAAAAGELPSPHSCSSTPHRTVLPAGLMTTTAAPLAEKQASSCASRCAARRQTSYSK